MILIGAIVRKFLIGFLVLTLYASAFADENEMNGNNKEQGPPEIGNLILPNSRQPGPLLAFGENILDKGQIQVFLLTNDLEGDHKHMTSTTPSIIYGITDDLSILLGVPLALSFKENQEHSSGVQDSILQVEYAYINKTTKRYVEQDTIVVNLSIPTGSSTAQPPTGFGSPNFFLGTTFSRVYADWLFFASPGALLTTANNNTQFGNQYLYQAGLGRNIFDIDKKWIFAWILEADGLYSEKNKINGAIDPNSGGNVVYLLPSLWISSKRFTFQLGVGGPAYQHLFGDQKNNYYLLALNLGWTFN